MAASILLAPVLLLTGCVSVRDIPAPIADSEIQRVLEDRLDAAWANTGLEGIVPRPESDRATLVERYRATSNFQNLFTCLQDQDLGNWGLEERDGGPVLVTSAGPPAEIEEQLIWYTCFAEHPIDASYTGVMLSAAESDYLYDYYQDWMLPCLRLQGYEFSFVPTRAEFGGSVYQAWIPYYFLSDGPGFSYESGLDDQQLARLVDRCGTPFPRPRVRRTVRFLGHETPRHPCAAGRHAAADRLRERARGAAADR